MRLAVLSDVHANLEALTAALDAIDARGVDAIYCLGDTVGYNADPAPCLDLVRERCAGVVMGNHDAAVAHEEGLDVLPDDGRRAAAYSRAQLSDEQLAYLANLPLRIEAHGCTFVHASPDDPAAWKRLSSYPDTKAQFDHFDTDVCFVGHSHVPAVVGDKLGVFNVRPGHRYLVNVGSVGQPRDRNPNLSFAFFDTETFDHETVRLPYNVDAAAAKVVEAGLPRRLSKRLLVGQ